jgi:HEAT repeat protein
VAVSPELLYTMMLVIGVNLALLALVTTVLNLRRTMRDRRSAQLVSGLRVQLLEQLETDDPMPLGVSRHERAAFVKLVRGLLPTLRGSDQARLSGLLDETGVIDAAFLDLHARSAVRRAAGADLLGCASVRRAVPELIRLLDDRDLDVRCTAARALGFIGDVSAAPALLKTIDTGRVPLNTSSMALLRMGRDARPALVEGLASGSDLVRATSAELLGLLVAISALPELTAAASADPSLEVRIRAIRALGTIGAPTSVDAIAAAMSSDQPASLRAVATRSLGRVGGPRTVTLLLDALNAPEHVVATNAARALAAMGDPGEHALSSASRDVTTLRGEYAREGLSYVLLARGESG